MTFRPIRPALSKATMSTIVLALCACAADTDEASPSLLPHAAELPLICGERHYVRADGAPDVREEWYRLAPMNR